MQTTHTPSPFDPPFLDPNCPSRQFFFFSAFFDKKNIWTPVIRRLLTPQRVRGCGWPTSSALETLAAANTAATRRMSPSAPSRAPLLSDARFCRVLHGSSYLLGACSPKHRGARCSSSSSVDLWYPRRFRGPSRQLPY